MAGHKKSKKDHDSSFENVDIVLNDKSKTEEKQIIALKNDECAIIITDDTIKFLCNSVDEMNEMQVAAAGAVIALVSPDWRSELISLVEDGIEEAYEEELEKEKKFIEQEKSTVKESGLKKDSSSNPNPVKKVETPRTKGEIISPFLDYGSLMKSKKGNWGTN